MSANPIHKGEKTEKPWGYEILWAKTKDYVGKILFVKAGQSLSLQYHEIKEETFILETGECFLHTGPNENALEKLVMKTGDVFHVPPRCLHRLEAKTDCRLYEVSTPHLSDVVRVKDLYGRK